MNSYLLIKSIHLTTVFLSLTGFLLRSYWRFYNQPYLQHRLVKILPHINDSLLLISALLLAGMLKQYPFIHDWLTIKIIFLVIYIISGSLALKTRYTAKASLIALFLAISSFSVIVLTALYHAR